jgi:hypothetical protein
MVWVQLFSWGGGSLADQQRQMRYAENAVKLTLNPSSPPFEEDTDGT